MTQTLLPPAPEAHLGPAVQPLLERLTAIQPGPHPVISCYVRLGPRDRMRQRYLSEIRSRIHELGRDPFLTTLADDARAAAERDLTRVEEWLGRTGALPRARGLAIFACEDLELFEVVPLPGVLRTRVVVDDTPWIAELAARQDELDRILVVVLDRAHVRFFEVTALDVVELPGLAAPVTRGGRFHGDRRDAPGWGERDYHGRVDEERHRRYAAAAERLEALVRTAPVRGIVLAGPADHTAALSRFLPGRLPELVLGTAKLNPTAANAAKVQAAALAAAEDHDRKAMTGELLGLEDALGTGWAVNDTRDTLRALFRGQVRTLFVREHLAGAGYRCAATGHLVLSRTDCRGEGEPQAVRDLVDEAIEEALRQRARVVMVPRQAAADLVYGLAATLRFK